MTDLEKKVLQIILSQPSILSHKRGLSALSEEGLFNKIKRIADLIQTEATRMAEGMAEGIFNARRDEWIRDIVRKMISIRENAANREEPAFVDWYSQCLALIKIEPYSREIQEKTKAEILSETPVDAEEVNHG